MKRKDIILVFGTKEYFAVKKNFKITLKEAFLKASESEKGLPFGDHYFILGDCYVFSVLANKMGGVSCKGLYVNGNTGRVFKELDTSRVFEKGDIDWQIKYSIRGLNPASAQDIANY